MLNSAEQELYPAHKINVKIPTINVGILSSLEPLGSQSGLKLYPCSGVRPSCRPSTIFKHLLSNRFTNQSQISRGASLGRGDEIYINGPGHMTKMATMPIYGKILKNSSSLEPEDL